jgi:hypothetical protein
MAVRSDSLHRQNAQRLAELTYKRKLYGNIYPPVFRSSTVSIVKHTANNERKREKDFFRQVPTVHRRHTSATIG